jgi:hypothetical protein
MLLVAGIALILACIIMLCGCACTLVRTPVGNLYRISCFYNSEVPCLVVTNGSGQVTLTGYQGKGDAEMIKTVVDTAVSSAIKSVK